MVDITSTTLAAPMCIMVRPDGVLHRGEGVQLLGLGVAAAIVVSIGFSIFGAWPVAPFVVLALAGLGFVFYLLSRHAGDFERIVIKDDWLIIDRHAPGGDEHFEFNGYWVQVVQKDTLDGGCAYLALRSHGQELVLGHHLSDDERASVGRALRARLARLRQ